MKRKLGSLLVVVAGLLLVLGRWLDTGEGGRAPVPPPRAERPPVEQATPAPGPGAGSGRPARPGQLASTGAAALDAQVGRVVAAMDATGRPPEGVVQGGRRGGPRGVFDNREGRLPRRGPGYYVESDVWPRGPGGRGSHRLVFGREREVYYTADHYRTFTRLR